jgi:S-(hydroxymethyl)mycothiol dehydrogenase
LAARLLDHGGTVTLVGLPKAGTSVSLDLYGLFDARARIRVSHGGDMLPAEDLPRLAQLALDGKLDLAAMVSRMIALDDVEEAFADMARGNVIRSVVRL